MCPEFYMVIFPLKWCMMILHPISGPLGAIHKLMWAPAAALIDFNYISGYVDYLFSRSSCGFQDN